MASTISVCEKCYTNYIIDISEIAILPNMRVLHDHQKIPKVMSKWAHWVAHVSTHCPDCRLSEIPIDCLRDWDAHQDRLNSQR